MSIAYVNARVLTERGFRDDVAVVVDNGAIEAIVAADDVAVDEVRDLGGDWLVPGFIDVQVNGGGDVLFNDAPTVETIRRIGDAHRRFGTTGFLPTLISDDIEKMRAAIAAVDAAIADGVPGVLGIHLEGPYLAPARRGVHDDTKFRVPDADDIALVASLKNGKTVLTLAPERVPVETIEALTKRGVIVCAGHTAATYEETRVALDAGLRGFTHLYNAMSPLTSREPGAVGAALDDRGAWCGVVVDGFHVHPAALRIALAAKTQGKVFLVTDAMPPVGGESATYTLGGATITCVDGRCVTADGVIAGSALDMAAAIRNSVATLGVDLAEAVRMAATYPADFLGLPTQGRIAPGAAANLVVLDRALRVRETL